MLSILTILIKNMILTGAYQNQVFKDPLTHEEEEYHINEMIKGSIKSREILIEHNLRLVAHIVKKYNDNSNIDDLISIGTIGLIKGVDTFLNSNGAKMTTYCARCIENEILMYFRNSKKTSLDVSMDEPIETDKNGNVLTLMDTIATDDSVVDEIDTKINIQKLNKYIEKSLTNREKTIICLRYGLNGNSPLPQRIVAKKLGISRSYVSRIEKKAIEVLKGLF